MDSTFPSWLSDAVFYEMYLQSYFDSNGDGIGDVNGLIEKLDYIKWLGCDAIWMNPCFESPFNDAGYDITDYYKIAKRYGTNADMKKLFQIAKRKGIKICFDLVPAHTSVEHPWFQQACQKTMNKYSNWYIWTNNTWREEQDGLRYINGYGDRNGNYLASFFWSQPALNYGWINPDPAKPWQLPVTHPAVKAVRKEMFKIMKFWLDMGADGFRVDMASTLVKNDPDHTCTSEFWQEVRAYFRKNYPDAVLISEWSNPKEAINAGFHVDFMIHFGTPAYTTLFRQERYRDSLGLSDGNSFFDKDGNGDITKFLAIYLDHFSKTKNKGHIAIPTGNHDLTRISLGRTQKEIEVAFAFMLTMPGTPFIHYGDEIGMRYIAGLSKEGGHDRCGSRTPMQWDKSKNAGFSIASRDKLYLPIDPNRDRPTVEEQHDNPNSLLNNVRRMIALRKQTKALCGNCEFTVLFAKPRKYPFVYIRSNGDQNVLVAINPSGSTVSAKCDMPASMKTKQTKMEMGSGVKFANSHGKLKIDMEPASYGIYQLL